MTQILFIVLVCAVIGTLLVSLYNILGRRECSSFYIMRRILIASQIIIALVAVYFVDSNNEKEIRLMTACLQDHQEYECEAILHRGGRR